MLLFGWANEAGARIIHDLNVVHYYATLADSGREINHRLYLLT